MSSSLTSCLLYTRDDSLPRQVGAYLQGQTRIVHCEDSRRFEQQLTHAVNALVLLDLRTDRAVHHLRELVRSRTDLEIVVLGSAKSDPMVEAEALGVFATVELPLARSNFQAVMNRAAAQLSLQLEIESLKEQVSQHPLPLPPPLSARPVGSASPPAAISPFSRSLRHINNINALMESIVESVAASTRVSRVGVFARDRDSDQFRLRAGLHCLEVPTAMTYAIDDPLIRWLEVNACQIARNHLTHIEGLGDRVMLKRELDTLGAEAILPLLGRSSLLGFLIVGNRATGVPFAYEDYEQLLEVAEHIATTIENAFLYEEVAIQRTLAETLLHALPTGTVSIGIDAMVKSINQAAETYLELDREQVIGHPVSVLGSQLGDILLRALRADEVTPSTEWTDPRTKNILVVEANRLMNNTECLGAVAIIHDVSDQRRIEEKTGATGTGQHSGPILRRACRTKSEIRWWPSRPFPNSCPIGTKTRISVANSAPWLPAKSIA